MNLFIFWALACSNILYQRFGVNVADYGMALNISFFQGVALCAASFSNWLFKDSK
jgi:hypothetical protein